MRRRRGLPALAAVAGLAFVVGAGCGGGGDGGEPGGSGTQRPVTKARIEITEPTANQVTGPDVRVKVNLIGAREVPRTSGPLRPDEGHIHVSVDGAVVAMNFGDVHELKGLTPGPHSVQVEFVAVDHQRFANRVVAAVLFTVQ